jgi:hypothetical protein
MQGEQLARVLSNIVNTPVLGCIHVVMLVETNLLGVDVFVGGHKELI